MEVAGVSLPGRLRTCPQTPKESAKDDTVQAFAAIDWHAPWFAPYSTWGQAAAQQVLAGRSVAQALNGLVAAGTAPDPGVRFVAQGDLPAGLAYEQFIFECAQVPTRDNLHDFFNGLMWLYWPRTKQRMNQLHGAAVQAQGVGQHRGPLRDALTLLDENAALLVAPAPAQAALRARQWQTLFIALRPLWAQARLHILGHALLEKLVYPRKAITAHIYQAQTAIKNEANIDAAWAADMDAAHLAGKPFCPLPVLGIPGWWADNANFSFYADSTVFRAARPAGA